MMLFEEKSFIANLNQLVLDADLPATAILFAGDTSKSLIQTIFKASVMLYSTYKSMIFIKSKKWATMLLSLFTSMLWRLELFLSSLKALNSFVISLIDLISISYQPYKPRVTNIKYQPKELRYNLNPSIFTLVRIVIFVVVGYFEEFSGYIHHI